MQQKTIKKQTSQRQSLKDRWVCVNSDSSLAFFLGPTLCDPMLCLKHRARGNATKDNKKKTSRIKVWRIDGYVLIQTLLWLCSSAQHYVTPCCVWSTEPEAMSQKTIKKTCQSQSLEDRWVCVNSDSSLAPFLDPTLCDPMLFLKHRARGNATKDNKKTDKSKSKFDA